MIVKTIIVEDDRKTADFIKNHVELYNDLFEVIGIAKSLEEAFKLFIKNKPSLIFLDINLEDGLGIKLLERLESYSFEVIFITAHSEYYEMALKKLAFSYILKPINLEFLDLTLERFLKVRNHETPKEKLKFLSEITNNSNQKILIQIGEDYLSTYIKDITHCEADGNYTRITLKDKSVLANQNLKYYEKTLNNNLFFRANRFTLINTEHIAQIRKKESIILSNGFKTTVSLRNKNKFSELISSLKL